MTSKHLMDLADEVYTLTGERVVVFLTTPKVIKQLRAEFMLFSTYSGWVALRVNDILVLPDVSMSPDTVQAMTRWPT